MRLGAALASLSVDDRELLTLEAWENQLAADRGYSAARARPPAAAPCTTAPAKAALDQALRTHPRLRTQHPKHDADRPEAIEGGI